MFVCKMTTKNENCCISQYEIKRHHQNDSNTVKVNFSFMKLINNIIIYIII